MDCCCPQCGSKAFKRNGFTRHGKQNHRCLDCGRQFSLDFPTGSLPEECAGSAGGALVENLALKPS